MTPMWWSQNRVRGIVNVALRHTTIYTMKIKNVDTISAMQIKNVDIVSTMK